MSDRIAELEARISRLEAALELLVPKPSELEQLFPGIWEKRWSGKGDGWDANGTEVFVAQNNTVKITKTTAGIRTSWHIQIEWSGKTIRLLQSHPRAQGNKGGLAPIAVEITGDAERGYTGVERVGDHTVTVEYSRFVGPIEDATRRRPKSTRSREEWQELARSRKITRVKRERNREAA